MNIETTLRDGLTDTAGALELPADPWPSFQQRETRHVRNRRLRVGVVTAVLAALTVLQSGVVRMPGWAPGIAIAAQSRPLLDSPTRGSLAHDTAWLAGMRAVVQDMRDDDGVWKITDRRQIKFLYAGEVGDNRLVLAYVPVRWGFITDPQLVWYSGPAGAQPEQMDESGNVDDGQPTVSLAEAASDRPGFAVVVGPQGSTASISTGFEYTAAGTVAYDPPTTGPAGTGIAEMVLPPAAAAPGVTFRVTENGHDIPVDGGVGWGGPSPDYSRHDAAITRALGGRQFDHATLRQWVTSQLGSAGLSLRNVTISIPWLGTVNGQPAALLTFQEPGHGVLAFALHGGANGFREDLRLLLPAKDAGRRPLAWRMRAEGKDDRTNEVHVVGPAGAAKVVLQIPGAAPVAVPLDADRHGTAKLPTPDTAATVTAYASDGTVLGTAPVPPFTDIDGIVGASPATRVVP
ncbi:hypothetical protein [Actinoplanes sp. N902-109]|uniref:hypothetical protein n=1 Tax=Actinoplanes sp. (strain N902-109) TaxID=649831 RepID=UPI0003295037|nr:hypothetical protein [Actinoplanes sp. N902-109]AGL20014.1 hypothetical protein L083_6504 [Actinoplanes sp. N902-109]